MYFHRSDCARKCEGETHLANIVLKAERIASSVGYSTADVTVRHFDVLLAAKGGWAVVYTPANRGKAVLHGIYVGVCRLLSVEAAPVPDMVRIHLDPMTPLPRHVQAMSETIFERTLREPNWRSYVQRDVRPLSDDELIAILDAAETIDTAPHGSGLEEAPAPYVLDEQRERYALTAIRRSAQFRMEIARLYGSRCMFTGLATVLGDGRYEAECSHFRPVARGGSDLIANAALVGRTMHWYVENGLLSLNSDYEAIGHADALDFIRSHNPGMKPFLPQQRSFWPSQEFLGWHRSEHGL